MKNLVELSDIDGGGLYLSSTLNGALHLSVEIAEGLATFAFGFVQGMATAWFYS